MAAGSPARGPGAGIAALIAMDRVASTTAAPTASGITQR